jgi:hypothetical protein
MTISIKKPELLMISDEEKGGISFGANQEWYKKSWNKEAGCGPTCASIISAYLAMTSEKCQALYDSQSLKRDDFLEHMDELFHYVTPGVMGVNHVDKFVKGMLEFAGDKGVALTPHVISVENMFKKDRKPEQLKAFVEEALSADSPIAFLNLSRGEETRLQGWHWITITEAAIHPNSIIAVASDEGIKREFDLMLWYMTTRMHGGLIYFT